MKRATAISPMTSHSEEHTMPDDILQTIDALVAEEHELRSQAPGSGLDAAERARLEQLEQRLDQCWDLLRQRRARVSAGEDPADARARPINEVESYQQ